MMHVCVYRYTKHKCTHTIFYRELAATVMKADKYQDLKDESVNPRPRRADNVVLILKRAALRPMKN